MLKRCVKAVNWFVISPGKVRIFSTVSTNSQKYLTSQVFFVRKLCTAFTHCIGIFKQPGFSILNLLKLSFPTLCTTSNNEAKLNKGFII